MQFRRVRSEKSEQMPEEKEHGREHEKKLIRHLRGEAGRVVSRRFPNQAAENLPDESEALHAARSLLCAMENSIKLSPEPIKRIRLTS